MTDVLLPLADYWWAYAAFTGLILCLLAIDLLVLHRRAHVVSWRESLAWSVVWVGLALAFAGVVYRYVGDLYGTDVGQRIALEFLTGYIIEKSLAVDNIFVFVLVFAYFAIHPRYQHRILFAGVVGALLFRAVFIALGSMLMQYSLVVTLFGVLLLLTGVKMLWASEQKIAPEKNLLVRLLRRLVPVTPELHGQRFFVALKGGWHATPLFVALIVLEMTDIIFAVDSVPAIFAISREPFIVFTSNMLAILGLRSLYFLLADAVERFHRLKYGLAFVLMFVGLKMVWLNDLFGGKFPIGWSLGIIAAILSVSVVASLLDPRRDHSDDRSAAA
jgi:tellurite resistance protein TerC